MSGNFDSPWPTTSQKILGVAGYKVSGKNGTQQIIIVALANDDVISGLIRSLAAAKTDPFWTIEKSG